MLLFIGIIYSLEGEKALDSYNQALPILRAAGDSEEIEKALHQIGEVYEALGEMEKALDFFYKQAADISARVK